MKFEFSEILNEEQMIAHRAPGSVMLIACPGSGKTRTLTYKIISELNREDKGRYVIAITYTNRAADEILDRIELLGVNTDGLWIGTIHSFCLEWILRPYGIYLDRLKFGYSIINPFDSDSIIDGFCRSYSNPKITPFDCGYYISSGKLVLNSSDKRKHANIKSVLKDYIKYLKDNNLIDFELLLFYSEKLIKSYPEISDNLSSLFGIILVDEFQDTKQIQYSIINNIFKSGKGKTRAFLVGDPNQSIFTSLGGYPISFDAFCSESGLKVDELYLSVNYRSSKNIIEYYSHYKVFKSEIKSFIGNKSKGIISYDRNTDHKNLPNEIGRILDKITKNENVPQEEICIVCPQWMPLASLTRALSSAYPQYDFDGPGMIPFGRDIENFWYKVSKLSLTEPSPDMFLRRIRWAGNVINHLLRCDFNISLSPKDLLEIINGINITDSRGMVYLEKFFHSFMSEIGMEIEFYTEIKSHYDSFFKSSHERLDKMKASNILDADNIDYFKRVFRPKKGITISTIHGVKGAEFECVIAYGLNEGMVPYFADPDQVNSAKKTLYVVSSRAKRYLFLISEVRDRKTPTKVLSAYNYTYDEF
ncbi:UvrD-helicase domain-containing protein [Serratia sp. TSA_130.2]|uniref:UvrD-helicase domain-containing protein n=1 Tax=unclassified Serratia (in: enterobacteria) TaxID=2647522 RepID=UPI0040465C08